MIIVAIHPAAARLHDRDMLSLGEPTFVWTREDLVESEAAPEEEVMDPAAARRLFPATQASQPERAGPKADTARQPAVATNKQRSQAKLQRRIAEECLEATLEARERARQAMRATPGAQADPRAAAELGDDWIDVLLDEEEALTADVLLVIWAALQGRPESPAGGGKRRSFQDEFEVTIPRKVKAADINKYLELAFGDAFEPLPEAAQGKHTRVCASETADAIRRGITIRGEEVKAHSKKRKTESDDSDTGDEEGTKTVKKGKDMGQTKGNGKQWFSGCYGCGEDHRWSACQAVGPLGQRKRCTRCDKIGHIAKVCADAAPARAAYIKKYGKPSSNRICRIRSAIGETAGAAAPRTRGIGTQATAPGAGTRTSEGAPGRETRRAGTGETGERRAATRAGKGAENAPAEGAERRATSATTQTGRGNAAGVVTEARAETASPRRSKRLKPEEGTAGHRPCSGLT